MPLTLGLVALTALWARQIQAFQVFRYWDSDEYFLMAEQLVTGEPITAAAPYAFRKLTPWLVARCCGSDIQNGFLLLNLAAGAALAVLLVIWLRRFVASAGVRLLVVSAFVLQWHGPVRFAFYYPAYVDPLFQVFVLAALIAGERVFARASWIAGTSYVALVAAGTFARETMLIVPACALLGAVARRRDGASVRWPVLALAAGVMAMLASRLNTNPRGGYRFIDAIALHLTNKPVESLLLVWFIAFGPLIAVAVYDWRATVAFLRQRLDLAALPVVCVVLAYIGGHDTERYLFWSMPVIYLLIARSVERHRALLLAPAITVVLLVAQALSQRVLWAVPDPGLAVTPLSGVSGLAARLYAVANRVFVIDDFHWNLWSNFGSRPFHLAQLSFYLAVSAAIIAMMHWRAKSHAMSGGAS